MKIIGVLSDTHLNKLDTSLQELFTRGPFREVDMIIHAGDFTSIAIMDYLENYVFYGVQGNMDDFEIRRRLPEKRVVTIEGVRIGITHGWGAPFDLDERVYDYFGDPTLDCIVFGHSHNPSTHLIGKTLMFNPGSFKHSIVSPRRTVGMLRITEHGKIAGEILNL